ncbi:type II toxin-antitoxin system RelE/ParE family toxin [Mangrovivirga halotolerans]|uniref:type II toxin-antitoxin system RelE/ParE family toxin n=1 Tax=Mangrovivirga halotolerans TaxID=2993936 RepID=UPI0034E21079
MVKYEVIWSKSAVKDKYDILEYWFKRNKSKTYSIRLNNLFNQAVKLISTNPESGKKSDYKNIRIKIVRHYLIFYLIKSNRIEIIRIWDSRRDLKNLKI